MEMGVGPQRSEGQLGGWRTRVLIWPGMRTPVQLCRRAARQARTCVSPLLPCCSMHHSFMPCRRGGRVQLTLLGARRHTHWLLLSSSLWPSSPSRLPSPPIPTHRPTHTELAQIRMAGRQLPEKRRFWCHAEQRSNSCLPTHAARARRRPPRPPLPACSTSSGWWMSSSGPSSTRSSDPSARESTAVRGSFCGMLWCAQGKAGLRRRHDL